MKRTMIAIVTIGMAGLLAAAAASAGPVSIRLQRQKMRIHRGVNSGALTVHEGQLLLLQHRKIRHQHRQARREGYLSYRENRHLQALLDRLSRKIHRLKHNHQWVRRPQHSYHGAAVRRAPKGAW